MEKQSSKNPKLEPDELIKRLMPDASQVPDVRLLVGFLGKSTREGYWRLYLTLTLNEYVEFDEDDVVFSHPLEDDENRLGGTLVWVRRDANLQHTRTVSREAQADFLQGAISSSVSRRRGRFGPSRRMLGFQPQQYHLASVAVHVSCVHEFCDWIVYSFLAGGDVFCEGSMACEASTFQAECG